MPNLVGHCRFEVSNAQAKDTKNTNLCQDVSRTALIDVKVGHDSAESWQSRKNVQKIYSATFWHNIIVLLYQYLYVQIE